MATPQPAGVSSLVTARRPGQHRTPDPARWLSRRGLVIGLVAAWVVPIVAYLAHAAVVLPLLILLATASLLRAGRSLLDRVVLALPVLYGALCVAGLLFSVWPFGLAPVPIAGLALTGLVLYAYLADRRPRLPKPTLADGLTVGVAALYALVVAFPFLAWGRTIRLSSLMMGEDGVRHFTIFDAIRHVDGYLFLHWNEALGHVYEGMITYPHGGHLTMALLDNFLRSSASEYGTGLEALDHYIGFTVVVYGLVGLAVLWAAQWMAARYLTLPRRIALVAAVFAFLVADGPFHLVILGYLGQALGIGLMVLLVAVLARPPARDRQAMWLIASLLLGIGFSYYLYLPAAGLAVLIWLIRRRAAVRRHRIMLLVVALAAVVAAIPTILGLLVGGQDAALLVVSQPESRDGLLVMLAVAAAGVLAGRAATSPVWRGYRWTVASAIAAWLALLAVQSIMTKSLITGATYYANKAQDLVEFVLILAAGALLGLLPEPAKERPLLSRPVRPTLARLLPAVAVAVALAAGSGLIFGDSPYQNNGTVTARPWVKGKGDYRRYAVDTVLAEVAGRTAKPGTVTVALREDATESYITQLLLSAVQRTSGVMGPGMYTGLPLDDPGRWDNMVEVLADHPILIIVDTDKALAVAEAVRDRHPDLDITIERLLA